MPVLTSATRHRRFAPLLWVSGLVAASVLVLGVNGTFASWTTAVVRNNTNTAATANAVVLQERVTGSSTVNADCVSSNGGFANTSTCTEINKYGGTATPLAPGAAQTSSVTLTNVGTGPGTKLVLTPGTCSQTPAAGTGTPVTPANLCVAGASDLNLNVACFDGTTIPGTGAYADLAYDGPLGAFTAAKTHTAAIAPNASISCRFTVTLSAAASSLDAGITVSQPLTWELDG